MALVIVKSCLMADSGNGLRFKSESEVITDLKRLRQLAKDLLAQCSQCHRLPSEKAFFYAHTTYQQLVEELKLTWGTGADDDAHYTRLPPIGNDALGRLRSTAKALQSWFADAGYQTPLPAEALQQLVGACDLLDALRPDSAEPITAVATAEPIDQPGPTPVKSHMPWQEVAERMTQRRRQGDAWPGKNELARQIGCSPSGITRAVEETPELQGWEPAKASVLSKADMAADNRPQSREADPTEMLAAIEECENAIADYVPEVSWFREQPQEVQYWYARQSRAGQLEHFKESRDNRHVRKKL